MSTPAYTGGNEELIPKNVNIKLATIPVQMKYHLGKYVYFNGGMFFNIIGKTSEEWSVKSRNGEYKSTNNVGMLLGCGVGVGIKYELLGTGVILSLNPYLRWNGLGEVGSFPSAQLKGFYFLQSGGSLGISYKF